MHQARVRGGPATSAACKGWRSGARVGLRTGCARAASVPTASDGPARQPQPSARPDLQPPAATASPLASPARMLVAALVLLTSLLLGTALLWGRAASGTLAAWREALLLPPPAGRAEGDGGVPPPPSPSPSPAGDAAAPRSSPAWYCQPHEVQALVERMAALDAGREVRRAGGRPVRGPCPSQHRPLRAWLGA